jgi:hypothetical protein
MHNAISVKRIMPFSSFRLSGSACSRERPANHTGNNATFSYVHSQRHERIIG